MQQFSSLMILKKKNINLKIHNHSLSWVTYRHNLEILDDPLDTYYICLQQRHIDNYNFLYYCKSSLLFQLLVHYNHKLRNQAKFVTTNNLLKVNWLPWQLGKLKYVGMHWSHFEPPMSRFLQKQAPLASQEPLTDPVRLQLHSKNTVDQWV